MMRKISRSEIYLQNPKVTCKFLETMLQKRERGEHMHVIRQSILLNLQDILTRSIIILPKDLPKQNTLLGIPTLDLQQMKARNN
jgi:hypothetical protein